MIKYVYECQWKKQRDEFENLETKTIPLILKPKVSDDEILESIEADELYGYLLVDIETPENLIESMSNFPPIIKRQVITNDLLSDYMKDRYQKRHPNDPNLKRETVIQCFSATNHLLLTPLVKFYIQIGLRITKIHRIVQYQSARSLAPFVKHVSSMRIEAVKAGNKTKANSAKCMGNAGYGKVIRIFL